MGTRRFVMDVTTDASQVATALSPYLSGKIAAIHYVKDGSNGYATGVDFTITAEATGETIWTQSNVDATVSVAPRMATASNAGVAALYASAGTAVNDLIRLGRDRIKIVIAQGGVSKTGRFHIVMED